MNNKEKDIVLKGIEKLEKDSQKVFTKNKAKDIINKNYNPLKVKCKIYKRGSGLYNMEDKILKEIKKDLNLKERIIVSINKKTFLKVFNKTRIETTNKIIK